MLQRKLELHVVVHGSKALVNPFSECCQDCVSAQMKACSASPGRPRSLMGKDLDLFTYGSRLAITSVDLIVNSLYGDAP